MSVEDWIVYFEEGDTPRYIATRIIAKLRAAEATHKMLKSWNEPFFTAWIEAYEKAGGE